MHPSNESPVSDSSLKKNIRWFAMSNLFLNIRISSGCLRKCKRHWCNMNFDNDYLSNEFSFYNPVISVILYLLLTETGAPSCLKTDCISCYSVKYTTP